MIGLLKKTDRTKTGAETALKPNRLERWQQRRFKDIGDSIGQAPETERLATNAQYSVRDAIPKMLLRETQLALKPLPLLKTRAERKEIFRKLKEDIREVLPRVYEDIEAAYERDPATKDRNEAALCLQGIEAVALYRIAHRFYLRGDTISARLINRHSHAKTSIDIHPGAEIGRRFFIDHGTGTVIGETAHFGDDCTVYHGVTTGTRDLAFEQTNDGEIKAVGGKRHATIGNGVIIWANATLVGAITIGNGSKIGANALVMDDVPPESTVVGIHSRSIPGLKNVKTGGC